MNSYSPQQELLQQASQVVSGIVSKQVVSEEFAIKGHGSKHLFLAVTIASTTHAGTQTILLQTAFGSVWEDSKSVAFTADGTFYIRLNADNADDKAYLPLASRGRIVVSQTHANDRATVTAVQVLQQL